MSTTSKVRNMAARIVGYAVDYYGLQETVEDDGFRSECRESLYEFLKYAYGGIDPVDAQLTSRPEGLDYFQQMYKPEAAWLLLGGTLPDQDQIKIKAPEFLWNILPKLLEILPGAEVIKWPHMNEEKYISEEIINAAISEYRAQLKRKPMGIIEHSESKWNLSD